MGAGMAGLVAAAMTQQVEQHDAVALGGQSPGQAAAEVGVEQQTVQPHEHPVARTVDLIGQPVPAIGQGVPRAVGAWLRVALRRHAGPPTEPGRGELARRSQHLHDPMVGLPESCRQIRRPLIIGPDGSPLVTFVPTAGHFRPDILQIRT